MDRRVYEKGTGGARVDQVTGLPVSDRKSSGKILARVYGYVAMGLAITAAVAFLVSFVMLRAIGPAVYGAGATEAQIAAASRAFNIYIVVLVVSGIPLLILSLVLGFSFLRKKSVPHMMTLYVIYCALMGVVLSSLLVVGIDFYTIGEAFGITALIFGVMALIGHNSKINLGFGLTILFALFMTTFLTFMIFLLIAAISGNIGMFWAVYGLSIAVSLITSVIVIFVIAFDSQQLKRAIASGEIDQYPHLEVFFAFHMYVDFINLFLRVLRVLLVLKNRN
jgi:FtsH-binding integral membrane protein